MATVKTQLNTTGKARIVIVDDHPIVRCGVTKILNLEPDLHVCAEATTSNEAIACVERYRPDLAIIDISLKDIDGLRLTRLLRRQTPNLRILILSMHDETLYARKALQAGAQGYVMKEEASHRLIEAVRSVLNGDVFVSPAVRNQVLQNYTGRPGTADTSIDTLSDRERQVFLHLGMGHTSRVIAEKLAVSVKTIDTHRARIKLKLGIPKASHLMLAAARWVQREGLVPSSA